MSTASFVKVLKACESAGGAGSKDAIKAALATLDRDGQTLFKYAMDMMLVFGVKKYPAPTSYAAVDPDDGVTRIQIVLEKLAAGKITGNEARDACTWLLSQFTADTAQYVARVIDKDLQAGFSVETYNKIHKNNQVTVFDVMLADKCTTEEEFEEIFPTENTETLADVKYDGERNVAIVTATGIKHHSRSGKIAEHMAGLFDTELQAIRARLGYDFILDGERMARTYIDTINAKKSGPEGEAAKKNMVFRAFFLMPLSDWNARKTSITMRQTRIDIAALIAELGLEKIILSDSVIVRNFTEMMRELDRVTTPGFQGMPKGQEGLILKRLDATYQWDRTIDWCKVKKFYDADMRIMSWEFGKKKNAKRMGRVNGHGWLEDGTYFEVGVGSGWTDKQREDFVTNFDANWKGRTLVVKYQEVSKSKGKEHASLRFPTVDQEKLLRDDKVVPLKD
jgi:ATP-dependent DNA ligase